MAIALGTAPVTANELQQLEFDVPVELVRGEILEMTRPGLRHGVICGNAYHQLRIWAESHSQYLIASNDTGVLTQRNPDTLRGPDVLAIRRDRLPQGELPTQALEVPPDLVVEVLSPHDRWNSILDKVSEYLGAGVLEAWVIDPDSESVHVFENNAAPRHCSSSDTLTSTALPGLEIPVDKLFAGV